MGKPNTPLTIHRQPSFIILAFDVNIKQSRGGATNAPKHIYCRLDRAEAPSPEPGYPYANIMVTTGQQEGLGRLRPTLAKTGTNRKHTPYFRRTTSNAESATKNRNRLVNDLNHATEKNAGTLGALFLENLQYYARTHPSLDGTAQNSRPVVCGSFSDVYRGSLKDGAQVAVKCLRISDEGQSEKALKRASREIWAWSKCKHPNILPLLAVTSFQDRMTLVSPWMKNGTLHEYIEREQVDRWQMCFQVAEGLTYIHDLGMVHGDLKAHNVLVSDEGRAKISDFGLSKHLIGLTDYDSVNRGTVRWMAPELIDREESDDLASMPADVWAFGMTVLEVLTGKQPYNEYKVDAQVTLAAVKGVQPMRPPAFASNTKFGDQRWLMITKCWEFQPEIRPLISNVKDMMNILAGTLYPV